jgi:site-specific recombinase XerC
VKKVQLGFFDWDGIDEDSNALITFFETSRSQEGGAASTIKSETSQLRSLTREARRVGLNLRQLIEDPSAAVRAIESGGAGVTKTTIHTRIRAYQRLCLYVNGDFAGRATLDRFLEEMPRQRSMGWHDAGISVPGSRKLSANRSPTPDAEALDSILDVGAAKSKLDGAIAGLACFSGLQLDEMCELRWRDIRWQDEDGVSYCEVRITRHSRKTSFLVVFGGAKALLSHALASGLEKDAYLFAGRVSGEHVSVGALKNRLREVCRSAGWPDVSRTQLMAALVGYIRQRGGDDEAIRLILGKRRVATIDRLSRQSIAIAAQLEIDEAGLFNG